MNRVIEYLWRFHFCEWQVSLQAQWSSWFWSNKYLHENPNFLPWRNINIRIPGSLWKKGRDGTNIVNCKILSRFSFIANIWHLNFYSCQEVGSRGAACVFWVDRAVDLNLYLQLLCLDNDICWHCAHAMSSLSTQVVSANSSLTNIWLG